MYKRVVSRMKLAKNVVAQAVKWIGYSESNKKHRTIVDIYNTLKPLPRGYKVKYTDSWCATFVSACSIKAGTTDILPCECSCQRMIDLFKEIGSWVEDESYVPKVGDIVFYDWQDTGAGDNRGWSDHVGVVETVKDNKIVVIEGNKNNAVGRRTISVNGKYIRGYGVPKYDVYVEPNSCKSVDEIAKEVIAGYWGNGVTRKRKLTEAGYDYATVQKRVNELLR